MKTTEFYLFVSEIDPKRKYPVRYWIDNDGNKHYEWKLLKGEDLTENQIFELFMFNHQLPKVTEITDEDIEHEAVILAKKHAKQSVGDFAVGFNWGAKAYKDGLILKK